MWDKLITTNRSIVLLILRLTLGIVIFPHGMQKLFGWFGGPGFAGEMKGLTESGIPAIVAFLVIIGESFGSLGLITGFLTRVGAFGILLIMLGAIFTVHAQFGFFMNWFGNKPGEGFEYHLLVIGIALVLLLRGGGAISVDGILQRKE